jgi:ABC-type multidrug transport system permease subunit
VNALRGLASIARKEFLHIRRDPTTLVFALLTPMLQLMLFGFAVNYDVRHIATLVVDQDRSRESREYIASLQNTEYLQVVRYSSNAEDAPTALRSGEARVAVIIPPDFSSRWGTASPPQVQLLLDGSDSSVANPAKLAFSAPNTNSPPPVEARTTVLYNPDNRTAVYTVPGLLCVILQLVTVTLTSFSLVRERETGTLDQLMVTPVGRLGLMLGKLLPYAGLASLEFFGVLFLARTIFNVPLAGSLWLLAALAVLFIIAALAMGLLISTLAQNQAQSLQFTLLTTLPSILLSGYIAPRETLPGFLTLVSYLFPVTYFIGIARGIMVRGAGLAEIWPNVVGLIIVGSVLLAISTARFRKSVS